MSNLPKGWMVTTLENFMINLSNGISVSQNKTGLGIPVSRIETISFEEIDMSRIGYVDSITKADAERFKLKNGDILFSHINSDQHLGKVAIYRESLGELYHGTNLLRIELDSEIFDPHFFIFSCRYMRKKSIFSLIAQHAVNQSSINQKKLKSLSFSLPPLAEQKRIVTKLDSLFAHTRRARQELDHIPKLIERYKQAILSAAFRGDLTADWRKERKLIDWQEIKLGELITDIQSGKNLKCEERPPRPTEKGVVKISAVTWCEFQPNNSKTFLSNFEPDPTSLIQIGDFLISRANTLELVGACVIVNETPGNLYLSDKVLRLCMPDKLKYWVLYFLRSDEGRTQIESSSTGNQLSMRNISQSAIRALEIPIPSEYEREIILAKINKDFQAIDRLEQEYQKAIKFLDRLEQSTLAKAFRGEIVPQDPNDEPASILLERIQKERENQPKPKKRQLSLFKEK